ncbi:MAG: hypothetical protein HYS52_00670 [Candidatus Wildermuthbacteria bacterium]|nr:hypothetical protein [Candidatus Wildermuthbacteria bacterium]
MNKYILIAMLAVALVGVPFVFAKADDDDKKFPKGEFKKIEKLFDKLEKIEGHKLSASSFFVGPEGQVHVLAGEVITLATATPAVDGVKVWGLNVRVDFGTFRSDLKVGDKVNIQGTINPSDGTITATRVHSLSAERAAVASTIVERIRKVIEKIREIQARFGLTLTPLP